MGSDQNKKRHFDEAKKVRSMLATTQLALRKVQADVASQSTSIIKKDEKYVTSFLYSLLLFFSHTFFFLFQSRATIEDEDGHGEAEGATGKYRDYS